MLTNRNEVIKNIIVMLLVLALPFIFYAYRLAPSSSKKWKTNCFEIDSGQHEDVELYLWFISVKILTLSIITIWYLTCRNYWRIILFVPIAFEIFKLYVIINTTDLGYNYRFNFSDSLIYSIPYILILFVISKKIKLFQSYNNNIPINSDINNQLIKLSEFDFKTYNNLNNDFLNLEKQKNNMDVKEYLINLIELRNRLSV